MRSRSASSPGLFLATLVLDGQGVFERLPTAVQALLAGITFAGGLAFASLLARDRWRRYWLNADGYRPGGPLGFVQPVLSTFYLLMLTTVGFAFLTGFLYVQGLVDVVTETGQRTTLDDPVNDATYHYAWGFLNAIPLLEIPKTAGWQQEFRLVDHVSPPLLLLYKLVVILPVIALGRMVIRDRREQQQASPGSPT